MQFQFIRSLCVASALAAFSMAGMAAEGGATRDDAIKMVKAGVAAIKSRGAEAVYGEITGKDRKWIKEDLYLVVYGLDGKGLAHGANPKQVGVDLIGLKDIDGKLFVKERVEMAKTSPSGFWQEYKFTNPETKRIEPKEMYCERLAETIVCGGVYK